MVVVTPQILCKVRYNAAMETMKKTTSTTETVTISRAEYEELLDLKRLAS